MIWKEIFWQKPKYIKLPIEKIANSDIHEDVNTYCPDDVTEIN